MKKGKTDIGKVLSNVFGKIDLEVLIEKMAPQLIPGMLASNPMLAQFGVTPQLLQAAMTAAPAEDPNEPKRIDVPSGGAFRLALEWHKIPPQKIKEALYRIMNDPQFLDVAEQIADAVYLAIGLNDTIEAPTGDAQQGAIIVTGGTP